MRIPIGLLICLIALSTSCRTGAKKKDNRTQPVESKNEEERDPTEEFKPSEEDADVDLPPPGTDTGVEEIIAMSLAEKDGVPELTVTYSYGTEPFYELTYNSAMTDDEISAAPETLGIALFNSLTAEIITPWTEVPRDALRKTDFKLADPKALKSILPELENTDVFFGVKDGDKWKPRYVLMLSGFCLQNPEKFQDKTPSTKPCSEVAPEDLSAALKGASH